MHLNGLRKADRLTRQSFDPASQCQVLTLYLLRVAFAQLMLMCIEMSTVQRVYRAVICPGSPPDFNALPVSVCYPVTTYYGPNHGEEPGKSVSRSSTTRVS